MSLAAGRVAAITSLLLAVGTEALSPKPQHVLVSKIRPKIDAIARTVSMRPSES